MKNLKSNIFLLTTFLVIIFQSAYGQTADIVEGCFPMQVQFTGTGSGPYFWDFKDGASSSIKDPSNTFINAGTYVVEFSNSSGLVGTVTIDVYPKPVPEFVVDEDRGCAPMDVEFENTTTTNNGIVITGVSWVFGDGNGAPGSPLVHTYSSEGDYNVSLELETNFPSCDVTKIFTNFISVNNLPQTSFATTPNPALACDTPLTVSFTNTSFSNNPLTYEWDFGNTNTSTLKNPPAETYLSEGDFVVTLTATDPNGCARAVQKTVSIGSPTSDFNVSDTLCVDIIQTMDNISSAGTYQWSFGANAEPQTSTLTNPEVVFDVPGFQDITLITSSTNGLCSDTIVKNVFIEQADATFTTNPNYTCQDTMTVTYSPAVTSGLSYSWFFNNGTSSLQNPSVHYVIEDNSIYSINDPNYLVATLRVTTASGCTAEYTVVDTIDEPNALLMPDVADGCVPLSVVFSDLSESNEPITSWKWVYGDGASTDAVNGAPQTHVYNAMGEYMAYLIIENDEGCIDTSYQVQIKVGDVMLPDFSVDKISVCPGEDVQFTDLTPLPLADSIDSWHYYTEGDRSFSCFQEPNPTWSYSKEIGSMDVALTVGFNGCFSTVTKPGLIDVKGPIAQMDYTSMCDQPFEVSFIDSSKGITDIEWDFGDGMTSLASEPSHTYATTGDYEVVLRASNSGSGCADHYDTAMVYIRDVDAGFNSDSLLCKEVPSAFNASSSVDVHGFCDKGYTWYFSDPDMRPFTTENANENIPFPTSGSVEVTLVVTDINGCTDTANSIVNVYGIDAGFTIDKDTICIPTLVTFDDTSVSDTIITEWYWEFGDGQIFNGQDTSHNYVDDAAEFPITFIVTNAIGCKDTLSEDTIIVYKPTSIVTTVPSITNICIGDSISFSATDYTERGSNLAFDWDFDDGMLSNQQSLFHTFSDTGTFDVKMTYREVGTFCTDSVITEVNVQGYPIAGFVTDVDTFSVLCYPQQVLFTDTSSAGTSYTTSWSDGAGTKGSGATFSITYPKGSYTGSLIVETTFGCKDTAEMDFEVVGPEGDFVTDKDSICRAEEVTFTIIDTIDVAGFTWDYGDGTSDSDINPAKHAYSFVPPSGQTVAKLIMTSDEGRCPVQIEHPIYIREVIADFQRNNGIDTAICFGEYFFSNLSQNSDSWSWDFGDGTTSNVEEPTSHLFPTPGTYQVTLGVHSSVFGCTDTIVKKVILDSIPVVTAVGDTICEGDVGNISISDPSSEYDYSWSSFPVVDITDTTSVATTSQPIITTDYYATVVDSNGCSSTDTTAIIVFNPLNIPDFDTTIVIGDSIALPLNVNTGLYDLFWNPEEGLSCLDCSFPKVRPLEDTIYTLTITDVLQCFSTEVVYDIKIYPETFVKLPTTFTPNGDGNNDVIYAKGWGIKELLEYKIFNRWGEVVFETDDVEVGWNGYYKGVLQNNDVYAYKVRVLTWKDEEKALEGYINLLR